MAQRNKLKFKEVFKITDTALRLNGSHPALSLNINWAIRSLVALSISAIILCLLLFSIIKHRVPNAEFADIIREATIALLAFTILCKYGVLYFNRNTVFNLIQYIDNDFDRSTHFSVAEKDIISNHIKMGLTIIRVWLVSSVTTGVLFVAKAFVLIFYNYCKGHFKYVHIFELVLPSLLEQHKNKFFGYFIINFLLSAFDACAIIVYLGFEPLIPIFLLHCCGQLEILTLRVSNLFADGNNFEDILVRLKEINQKLQTIYKFAEDVQITFVPVFEFTMKITTLETPFTIFEVVQSLQRHEMNIEFLFLISGVLLQFYMPCYYSNMLMEKSKSLRLAIYSCGWEKYPNPKIRSIILFMLTRTGRPVVLNTFFYPLTLETFAEMCRQAYALYSILNAVF